MTAGTIAGGIKSDGDWIIDQKTVTFQPVRVNGAALDLIKNIPGHLDVQLGIPAEELFYSTRVKLPPNLIGGSISFFVAWDGQDCWRIGIDGTLVFSTFPDEQVG
jgi:hypothetical protein